MTVITRMSELYAPTLKEDPSEAEVASHRILLRAGMMRKVAAGIYTFLPLGKKALAKVEGIVREEMDAIGCQEILMPAVQPAELWHESGRWDAYGPELMRLTDRHGREFCLGPTHEEIITALVRHELRSYRDLPTSLYQIQVKFRDEIRPRFGLLRGREFIMKDAYSFHADQESLQEHYDQQSVAYGRICDRLGLEYRPVEADSGQIGGSVTTEFMALAETGEAALVYCASCDYAANTEAAASIVPRDPSVTEPREMERVATPGLGTIAELAEAFDISTHDTVKTMVGKDEQGLVFFMIPGDRELNPLKAAGAVPGMELLDEEAFAKTGLPKGSLGPVNAPEGSKLIADGSLQSEVSWNVGANEDGFHLFGAMPGRDFEIDAWADVTTAQPEDGCPRCDGDLLGARGIEVSQVFQLGTKYSESMGATFTDEDGEEHPFVMGCYGVGVTRSLAAVIEQHSDDDGVMWPASVAPFHVVVLPLSGHDEVVEAAADIAKRASELGLEVLLDDRDERAGVKFADADLIGLPYQLIVGNRGLSEGKIEMKVRASGERSTVTPEDAPSTVLSLLKEEMATLTPPA